MTKSIFNTKSKRLGVCELCSQLVCTGIIPVWPCTYKVPYRRIIALIFLTFSSPGLVLPFTFQHGAVFLQEVRSSVQVIVTPSYRGGSKLRGRSPI